MNKLDEIIINAGIKDRLTIVKIKYGLEIVRTESVKIIVMSVFFSLIGQALPFLFVLLTLSPLRCLSGGMHLKTKMGCFLFSFAIYFYLIVAAPHFDIPTIVYFSMLIASSLVIFIFSPVFTKNRPIKTTNRFETIRLATRILISIYFIALIILYLLSIPQYFILGVWMIVIQSIQLVLAVIKKRGGKKHD